MHQIRIMKLKKANFEDVRQFAIDGMHLDWYVNNKLELYLYSQYFIYTELARATHAYGAYIGNNLVGVLLANMHGQPKTYHFPIRKWLLKLIGQGIALLYGKTAGQYDTANQKMLTAYLNEHQPDGELNLFAVKPNIIGRGIGTRLLNQLSKDEAGKQIYLYTDSGSTYQFYFHRGFEMSGKTQLTLERGNQKVPLTCYVLHKQLTATA